MGRISQPFIVAERLASLPCQTIIKKVATLDEVCLK